MPSRCFLHATSPEAPSANQSEACTSAWRAIGGPGAFVLQDGLGDLWKIDLEIRQREGPEARKQSPSRWGFQSLFVLLALEEVGSACRPGKWAVSEKE